MMKYLYTIGLVLITHITHAGKKINFICDKTFCFFTVRAVFTDNNPLLPKKGLFLKERICSQREQILFFKNSAYFGIDTRENFQNFPGCA